MTKLTVTDILTSSGRYKDRASDPECTQTIKDNAQTLCNRVNAFMEDLGWTSKLDVTSGFRTSIANDSTSNAGKRSSHLSGQAGDFLDNKTQDLALKAAAREDLLVKHDLYMEHPSKTIGKNTNWLHLSSRAPKSGKRIFYP